MRWLGSWRNSDGLFLVGKVPLRGGRKGADGSRYSRLMTPFNNLSLLADRLRSCSPRFILPLLLFFQRGNHANAIFFAVAVPRGNQSFLPPSHPRFQPRSDQPPAPLFMAHRLIRRLHERAGGQAGARARACRFCARVSSFY